MRQKEISIVALIVSVLSLILSAYLGIREYKEKAEIVVDDIEVDDANLEGGNYIVFRADIIVANMSKPTISFIKGVAHVGWDEYELQTLPELPISLVQGYANKMSVRFKYPLSSEQVSELISGGKLDEVVDHNISIQLRSAKRKIYSGTFTRLDNVRWVLEEWYK